MEKQIDNNNEMNNNQNTNKIEGENKMNNADKTINSDVNNKVKGLKKAIKSLNARHERMAEAVWKIGKSLTELKKSNDFKDICKKYEIKSTWNDFCETVLGCSRIYVFFMMNAYEVRENLLKAGVIAEDKYVPDSLARILHNGKYEKKVVDIWKMATGDDAKKIPSEKKLRDACENCCPFEKKHPDKEQSMDRMIKEAEKFSSEHHLTDDEIEDMVNKFRNALLSAKATTASENTEE